MSYPSTNYYSSYPSVYPSDSSYSYQSSSYPYQSSSYPYQSKPTEFASANGNFYNGCPINRNFISSTSNGCFVGTSNGKSLGYFSKPY